MTCPVRVFLAVLVMALVAASRAVLSQGYPIKPIRVASNASAGSPGDVAIRLMAVKMSGAMGQPVVVEIRPGAGGAIAASDVIRSDADGYSILYTTGILIVSKFLMKTMPVDVLRDFVPISLVATVNLYLIVHESVPAKSIQELVTYAKRNPGKLSYATNGVGSGLHLFGVSFSQSTGTELFHVPYGSGNNALRLNDFLEGRVSIVFAPYDFIKPNLAGGKIRVLAITDDKRTKHMPDIPAITESFPTYMLTPGFFGLLGRAGLPQPILARLEGEAQKALLDPNVVSKLDAIGVDSVGSSAQSFGSVLRNQVEVIGSLIKAAGLTPQ